MVNFSSFSFGIKFIIVYYLAAGSPPFSPGFFPLEPWQLAFLTFLLPVESLLSYYLSVNTLLSLLHIMEVSVQTPPFKRASRWHNLKYTPSFSPIILFPHTGFILFVALITHLTLCYLLNFSCYFGIFQ